jgi:nucleoside-diphosphate-sugar epimerase
MENVSASDSQLHVVLGAGQVGPLLCERLLERGLRVRMVRRAAPGPARPGVEWAQAELSDPAAASAACAGAAVIYDCTNPSGYASWPRVLPPLKRGIRAAATRTGALLVQLDNVYMYGVPADGVLRESTPLAPSSEKGRLRAALSNELFEAVARGELRASVGRASDFFGPGAASMSVYGDGFLRTLARGRGAIAFGDPDLPRSYSYIPDVVNGLLLLGAQPERSAGRVFHLPVAWKAGSTREFIARFAAALGAHPRVLRLPPWLFSLAGLFSKDLGAMREMMYQWQAPFVVDDSLFEQTFGVGATPPELAIAESVRAAGLLRRDAAGLAAV